LIQGPDGNFYGTTRYGGTAETGTVFELTPAGVLSTLASLVYGQDSVAGLTLGANGTFYGTTTEGGSTDSGTIFQFTVGGGVTTLVDFGTDMGGYPQGSLIQAADGFFYGTTGAGGTSGDGTVFRYTSTGTLTTWANFNPTNGKGPTAGLIQATDGNFYGTTQYGGSGSGSILKMTPDGSLSDLGDFSADPSLGYNPLGPIVQGADGNFYGTTSGGGVSYGGTVFKFTSTGTLTTFYAFPTFSSTEGAYPSAGVILGSDGNFYGTTKSGGVDNSGTAFELTPGGTLTTLISFGAYTAPVTGLIQGKDGAFYGTFDFGFNDNEYGSVFRLASGGSLTSLGEFNGLNGQTPLGNLIQGNDGSFYGTTSLSGPGASAAGTLFQVTPDGDLTTEFTFTGLNGSTPQAGLLQAADGDFYGTTSYGGMANSGTVFRFNSSSKESVAFNSAATIPISATHYEVSGSTLQLTLKYAPSPIDVLTVVQNTGGSSIVGAFTNLPDGGTITGIYGCNAYTFTASYSGGSGYDLTLTLQSKNYTQWAAALNFTGGIADPVGSDGIPNLLKYLYNVNPGEPMTATDRAALPAVGIDSTANPGTQYLTLTYRQYALATGVNVVLQTSTDLKTWKNVNPPDLAQQIGTDANTGDPIMEVGVVVPPNTTRQFIRLNVTQ
jgi:uncharacterized repeat protein (TIGR03803 family)